VTYAPKAASATARVLARAHVSFARIVRSACSRACSIQRTRSGRRAHSCLSLANSRSTAPRLRSSLRERSDSRGMSGWRRSALIHTLAAWHSLVGPRHLIALRSKSASAETQTPCRQQVTTAVPGVRDSLGQPWVVRGCAVHEGSPGHPLAERSSVRASVQDNEGSKDPAPVSVAFVLTPLSHL
jgi:hypothetical protein